MIQFNGSKIKDIMYNGAYIQTVMQNGNILYQRTKPLADGAYIQTVNGDTFTETEYKDMFSSLKTVTKKQYTLYALSDFDSSIVYTIESDYDTAVYMQVNFYDRISRDKHTIVEVLISNSTNEVHAIKFVKNISDSGTTGIKFYRNDVTSSFTSRYTIIPKDKLVNGFLFKKDDHKVLCAALLPSTTSVSWGTTSFISTVPAFSTKEEAIQDFNGAQNTDLMMAVTGSLAAAGSCKDYVFPNGISGYLPACGELNVVANYLENFKSLFRLINNTSIGGRSIWSSTQDSSVQTNAYCLNVAKSPEGITSASKASLYTYLPFQTVP